MQIHDVVFITLYVTFFVEGTDVVGVVVVVSVVVVIGVVVVGVVVAGVVVVGVVIEGVVVEVAKHNSGLVIGFFIAQKQREHAGTLV